MSRAPPIEVTPDGSATVYSKRFGQHYHNRNGALTQARSVFLEGTKTDRTPMPHVLEIGFGLGLNFLTTLLDVQQRAVALEYLAYEIDPQPVAWLAAIGDTHPARCEPLWQELLRQWPTSLPAPPLRLDQGAHSLEVRFADASVAELPVGWADAIYLDGFSPAVNAELWSDAFLCRLALSLRPDGWLATYSAAGSVRRGLGRAGLRVERRPGAAGKREWLRAQKC
jgi:tRNA U34 5-methylaminomethyl-2-thiouridine-forming methyltransferase MnmC